ncbi:winged helix-turn-helix transcriptional regulator [Phytomonospora endophytica]|uniref:DNA-binding HxlR family transcriptional regulator n=1 Tax=Phytomonospora endophytica TaxID=714109 RepID=A0A841G2Z5_9ACTN|nr:winged helix-turn-helix transcriptional regulator [Phytomonospora endophytica]MBB6038490.1 DNA-binding HxlR family transcriptional regulator [Phytomonospora endophytica]GIG64420.1 transcriptional regulator [Phytomonospora endophytica]
MPPKRTYGQGCPVAHALDLVGERWSMLVIRELRLGPRRYADIQNALPGIGPSVLSQRLRDLEAVGILEKRDKEYGLTAWGAELEPVFRSLAKWGARSPVVPLEGPISHDSAMLGLRTFFRPGDADWTASYEFYLRPDSYRLEVTGGELTGLWRGRGGQAADVRVETDLDGLDGLVAGRMGAEDAVREGKAVVSGKVAELRRLVEAVVKG